MTKMQLEKILVVGATSSIAQAICHTLARQGYVLILAGRNASELEILSGDLAVRYGATSTTITVDFEDDAFSAEQLLNEAGGFDHAIIASGDMGSANPEDIASISFIMYINYIVPAQIATLAAQRISERKLPSHKICGSVVLISSVAGDRGRQSNYAYGSTKAALSTFASGLRNRYFKKGVHVMTVKPGFVDTPMTWGMKSGLIAPRELVAEQIVSSMQKHKNVIYVPFFWRYIMLIIMHIPEAIFKRLSL